ncbi:MAG: phytanoyl-CoA dioxygenase family protein, partial [Gammaproteobacteria bacterium]|nr:phytanoyl-CoA dioxygenase family protein [Gammaproteobacteria bacterium]
MTPEEILAYPNGVLSLEQRCHYFDRGYVVLERLFDDEWLKRLCAAHARSMGRSRTFSTSNKWFSLEPTHTAEHPRVRRIERLPDQEPVYWQFASESVLVDVVADILGPNVVYRDSMTNVKCANGTGDVTWHQDFVFYPHTNLGTIQALLALENITTEQGPLRVVPESHKGPIFEHYDDQGQWIGEITQKDLTRVAIDSA